MATKKKSHDLLGIKQGPNPERIANVKRFHVEQAVADHQPIALISITLLACGNIITTGIGIEAAHGQAMLSALYATAERIEQQLRPATPVTNITPYATPRTQHNQSIA
jgi:hypothetical protein